MPLLVFSACLKTYLQIQPDVLGITDITDTTVWLHERAILGKPDLQGAKSIFLAKGDKLKI